MKSFGMIKIIIAIILSCAFMNCSKSENKFPFPESHPAYKFYQIARSGSTTLEVCESYGGIEIYPIDYEIIEILEQGVVKIRQKSTNKIYLGVSFGTGGAIVTVCLCCWQWE